MARPMISQPLTNTQTHAVNLSALVKWILTPETQRPFSTIGCDVKFVLCVKEREAGHLSLSDTRGIV